MMRKNHKSHPKYVNKPQKSELLAEFFGIMLGDGGMTKYQISITLNRYSDRDYITFVEKLITDLFNIKPHIILPTDSTGKSIVRIQISRKELVDYFNKLGLITGNKVQQQVSVPAWILQNDKFRIACLRGLIDTDGCFYINVYTVNKKPYSYKKIAFSNRSFPLLRFVYDTCNDLGLNPYITEGIDVRITSSKGIKKYIDIVSTHNHKHLKRFEM